MTHSWGVRSYREWNFVTRIAGLAICYAMAASAGLWVVAVVAACLLGILAREARQGVEGRIAMRSVVAFFVIGVALAAPTSLSAAVEAIRGPIRLMLFMVSTLTFVFATKPTDCLWLARRLRAGAEAEFAVMAAARFIPLALDSYRTAFVAQQARGLVISFRGLARRQLYEALVIPALVVTLKSALRLWIGMHLRPASDFHPTMAPPKPVEFFVLAVLIAFWIL